VGFLYWGTTIPGYIVCLMPIVTPASQVARGRKRLARARRGARDLTLTRAGISGMDRSRGGFPA